MNYNTEHAQRLAVVAREQYRNGSAVITVGACRLDRNATIDGINAVRVLLTALDTVTADESARFLSDIWNAPSHLLAVAEFAEETALGFEVVENVDGSAHAEVAPRVTDTETVTVRKADGTTEVKRQTASEARTVIEQGHANLLTKVENGEIDTVADYIEADEL